MQPVFNKAEQLGEQILKILEGRPSNDNKFSWNQIILMVKQELALQIKINLFTNYKVGEAINPGQYITTFEDVPVKTSASRNRDYIDLPARFVDLPGGKGVWGIGPMGNDWNKFIPVKAGATNFGSIHNVPFLQGNVGYEIEGMRALFTKDLIDNGLTSCLVQLVTTDVVDVNITQDMDTAVIKGVLAILGIEAASDKIDDNNESR
jgi:hypothetical protein